MTDFTKYHLTGAPRVLTQVPGPRSMCLLEKQKALEGSIVSYPHAMPIAIRRAKGAIVEDVDGNLFIDFLAGAGVLNLGHCNEYILDHVFAQAKDLIHALDFPTEVKLEAIERILESLPAEISDQFKVAFVGPTGADAVEAAVKLAKMKTGRDTIIAFTGAYHGISTGTVALTSNVRLRVVRSSVPNVHFAPFPYCYRCPVGREPESCAMECFTYLQNMIRDSHSGVQLPAAILIEPIQGEGGSIPAATRYLEALVTLARSHGIITIFDEIQAGFFRSGQFLSFMHGSAFPDIITVSKGFGGVGIPLAGLIYRRSVEVWGEGDHVGTFRGNPLALAACKGALDFVAEHQIGSHVDKMGQYLVGELKRLIGGSPYVGDIRGKGLMIGIEFVDDKHSKDPFPELVKQVRRECLQQGLLFEVGGHHANVIRLMPPLLVTPAIIDDAVRILCTALQRVGLSKEIDPARSHAK